ncbi:unnamed protein product [Hymenolepis diminuta]|uniref:ABC transmembrane type-1 domain-containing protein n=1 Tax=Hymenolepis diminuta TaxID=6216 RepID=A0A0R3S8V2_HYMDI|nr:unnamed protein product [Hymenolepis diminuta]
MPDPIYLDFREAFSLSFDHVFSPPGVTNSEITNNHESTDNERPSLVTFVSILVLFFGTIARLIVRTVLPITSSVCILPSRIRRKVALQLHVFPGLQSLEEANSFLLRDASKIPAFTKSAIQSEIQFWIMREFTDL